MCAQSVEPRMPDVESPPDVDLEQVFRLARNAAIGEDLPEHSPRQWAVVTPGRNMFTKGCPEPGSIPLEEAVGPLRRFPPAPRLHIAVIGYTDVETLARGSASQILQAIPFVRHLIMLAYIGHAVWMFEGHHSAFEVGVSRADVLLIDSGMVPFLQGDWFSVAQRALAPTARIYLCDRDEVGLKPVIPSDDDAGWEVTEADDEESYVNGLLWALALHPGKTVTVEPGRPVPDLGDFPVEDALPAGVALPWFWKIPFLYPTLDAGIVISIVRANSKRAHGRTRVIDAAIAETGAQARITIKKRRDALELSAEPR